MKLAAFILISLAACDALKVLVIFPVPGKSHSILGEGYVRHLLKAGHEVTYITPLPLKPTPRLRQIEVSSNFNLLPSVEIFDISKMMFREKDVLNINVVLELFFVLSNGTLFHENVQKLMLDPKEEFDVVLVEWMFSELYSGFSSVFNCPFIWSSSMEPHPMVLKLIDEVPNPAYTTDMTSSSVPPMSFTERVQELMSFTNVVYKKWLLAFREARVFDEAFSPAAAKRGLKLPSYEEVKLNASVMLGNSHVSVGQAVRLPQSYIPIAGYHIEEPTPPLSAEWQNLMDNAKDGVIYFSMGSMLTSKSMPDQIKKDILVMFSKLKQTVIWKLEEVFKDVPKNVHIVNFAPQQSILAHKNCVLFITHGGLLSTIETVHFGVPVIGIPMYADQFLNVNRAIHKGFAKTLNFDYEFAKKLKETIEEIIGNPKYRERVKEISVIYHDRPVSPGKELVHWVEHVAKTRGALHLRSPALLLPWYQKLYLDLAAIICLIVIISLLLINKFVLHKKVDINKKLS